MIIDKPVIECYWCSKAVRESWQLLCDDCYRKLKASPVDVDSGGGKRVRVDSSSGKRVRGASDKRVSGSSNESVARDGEGRLYVCDKSGQRYVLDGESWRRCSES